MNKKNTIRKTLVMTLAFILLSTTIISIQAVKPVSIIPMQQKPVMQLQLAIPSSMSEGREFVVGVYVFDDANRTIPIANATVFWLNGTYFTDSTGRVLLTAPYVDADAFFEIRASKSGYLSAVGQILIEDGDLPQLMLAIPPSMMEGRLFTIGVYTSSGPTPFATVYWLNGSYLTNDNGTVELLAPSVSQATCFEISARKQGYLDATGQIRILNENQTSLQLAIPPSMMEGREFTVGVYTSSGPTAYAMVNCLNVSYMTNANGIVVLTAPSVDYDISFGISAHKQGYQDAFGSILILNHEPYLAMEIFPSPSILEGSTFIVRITAEQEPIASAEISWLNQTYYTSYNGTVTLIAPYVDSDTNFIVSAHKEGYVDVGCYILVQNEPYLTLEVIPSPTVLEGSNFIVRIASTQGPVAFAQVTWMNQTYCTSDNGTVALMAPFVDSDTNFVVSAHKDGYVDVGCYILVKDVHHLYHPVDTNRDFNIQIEELTSYAAAHGASDPDVVTATFLWQHGESYFWDYSSHNWMPVY
ncbi:MAG: hypothetical protein NT038_07730 [Euryarchaeota archaeon]|nr:hypothetical protein [Euryarchaeota archaeon]